MLKTLKFLVDMFVPDKMKLNKFKLVHLPRPIEYVQRFGLINSPSVKYSGDDISSPFRLNKTEQLAQAESMLIREAKDHENK